MLELNKIYNMDCLEGMKQLEAESIDLIVTDPPYGIDWQSSRRIAKERFDKIKGDTEINTGFISDCYRILKNGGAFYCFTRWDVLKDWQKSIEDVGFNIKSCIIWDRGIHGLGDLSGAYAPRYDMVLFSVKGRHILKGKRPQDVIKCNRPNPNKIVHPTQKPVNLIQKFIKSSSKEEDVVLDCFMGSGTTAFACKQLGRNFIGFEISEEYCDIANKRLEQSTLLGLCPDKRISKEAKT